MHQITGAKPDFENLKHVLMGGRGWRVPNVELVIDGAIKAQIMGKPVVSVADDLEFRRYAGYDYAWVSIGMVDPAGTVNKELVDAAVDRHYAGEDGRVWAAEHEGRIYSEADLEQFPWPNPATLDYSPFLDTPLPEGMKFIAILGKIFTATWELLGYEQFCLDMCMRPDFLKTLVKRVGDTQLAVFERVAHMDSVGAVWVPDDIAYHTGLMAPPDWLREHVFSYYRQMAEVCRALDKPFIYHSDGDLWSFLDTILDTGFNALHPIEPESMDIYAVREYVGKRICLMGNIRVHTLASGTPDEIQALVRDRIEHIGYDGAYCVGSSNSVPDYVPVENYMAMLKASAEYGAVPGAAGSWV